MERKYLPIVLITLTATGLACAPLYATTPASEITPDDVALQVVELVNDERREMDLQPFLINDQLIWMAQVRSDDMVAAGYVGHFPPPGHPTLESLTEGLGYNLMQHPVELIAQVPVSDGNLDTVAQRAVDAWRSSHRHWRWVSSEYYWITGVGITIGDDEVIVTQLLWGAGSPEAAQAHNRPAP
jgi:uncharacterized protein YkwD